MKKKFAILICFIILASSCTKDLSNETVTSETTQTEIQSESVLSDGEFTYSMIDDNSVKIVTYTGQESELEIPETLGDYDVKIIGEEAFSYNINLISVIIPKSVLQIDRLAFSQCVNLLRGLPKTHSHLLHA